MDLSNLSPIEVVALTIYGESRGEPIEGQIAVGCVIRNRVNSDETHKLSYSDVCLKPRQFSCWNLDDPNYSILSEMANKLFLGQNIPDMSYQQCSWVATGIVKNFIKDNTRGAKNYLTSSLFNSDKRPKWAKIIATDPKQIGNQTFFNV